MLSIPSNELMKGVGVPSFGVWNVRPCSSSFCRVWAVVMSTVGGQKIGGCLYFQSCIAGSGCGGDISLL